MTDLAAEPGLFPAHEVETIAPPRPARRAPKTKQKTADVPARTWTRRTGAGARINADNIWVYRAIVVLVTAVGTSGIIMSWDGLLYAAAWTTLPEQLRWTFAVALDVPVATLALAALAMRSRGRDGVARWFTILALIFTALSGLANFLYVASVSGLADYTDWVGAIAKGIAPAITLVMTEVLGALVTRPTGEKGALAKARADIKTKNATITALRKANREANS